MTNEKPASPTQAEELKAALDCVVHALMVLPVPIDGQGKRAWASLLEAQTLLESALDRTTLPHTERPTIFMDEKGNVTTTDGQAVKAMFDALEPARVGSKLLPLVPAGRLALSSGREKE